MANGTCAKCGADSVFVPPGHRPEGGYVCKVCHLKAELASLREQVERLKARLRRAEEDAQGALPDDPVDLHKGFVASAEAMRALRQAEEQVEGLRGLLDRFSSAVDLLQGSLPSDQEYVPEVRAGLDEVIAALAEHVTGADELPQEGEPCPMCDGYSGGILNPNDLAHCPTCQGKGGSDD